LLDTVERNILDLAARQGLSLYTLGNSAGTLNVSALATDADERANSSKKKKVQKGDFIFRWVYQISNNTAR
jgi:E3 ubiquitin-protein ligase SHPRH